MIYISEHLDVYSLTNSRNDSNCAQNLGTEGKVG